MLSRPTRALAAVALGAATLLGVSACSLSDGATLVQRAGELAGNEDLSGLSDALSGLDSTLGELEAAVKRLDGAVTVVRPLGEPTPVAVTEGDQYLLLAGRGVDAASADCALDPAFGTLATLPAGTLNIPLTSGTRFTLGQFTATASGDAMITCEAPESSGIVVVSAAVIESLFPAAE